MRAQTNDFALKNLFVLFYEFQFFFYYFYIQSIWQCSHSFHLRPRRSVYSINRLMTIKNEKLCGKFQTWQMLTKLLPENSNIIIELDDKRKRLENMFIQKSIHSPLIGSNAASLANAVKSEPE